MPKQLSADDWGEYIVGQLYIPDERRREWLKRQIVAAVADEREACAITAETTWAADGSQVNMRERVGRAIRARGKK